MFKYVHIILLIESAMSCIGHISSMFLKAKSALKLSFEPKGALLCGWAVKGQGHCGEPH